MKPQHDLRAGEALIRHDHKITDHDGAFWSDLADELNSAASRFDLVDVTSARIKLSPRETRELNRQVAMANHYMAAHGLNEDGSYTRSGILAMLSGVSLVAADAERLFERVDAAGRYEFHVDRRDYGGTLIEGWTFSINYEGDGYDLREEAHEVVPQPEPAGLPPVGHRWTDNDGWLRIKTPWGFNGFADERGARAQAVDLGRVGQHWYIWRLADGSYDVTASANPQTPGHPATLVDVAEIQRMHGGHRAAVSVPFRTGAGKADG